MEEAIPLHRWLMHSLCKKTVSILFYFLFLNSAGNFNALRERKRNKTNRPGAKPSTFNRQKSKKKNIGTAKKTIAIFRLLYGMVHLSLGARILPLLNCLVFLLSGAIRLTCCN
jgi:hypothetical protein